MQMSFFFDAIFLNYQKDVKKKDIIYETQYSYWLALYSTSSVQNIR